jgi:competence protein ComFC
MIDAILNFFFPEYCIGCKKPRTALCADCADAIPPSRAVLKTNSAVALFSYDDGIVQSAIKQLKYSRRSSAAKALAGYGSKNLAFFYPSEFPIVLVPIPQHRAKTRDRGFNQSSLIAAWLQPVFPSSIVGNILEKYRSTKAQAGVRNKTARKNNLTDSMRANTALDANTLYIIVDDVITTGSTIYEASRALRAAGAVHVCAVAMAHGSARK